jgi:hypothetical protein
MWSIGRLLPRLMVLYLALDLVLRLIPLDPLTFRAWEAMLRHWPNAVGPFIPNKHYHREDSYGGVASIGNLPALREYRVADFATDAYGFPNPPALVQTEPVGIVVGDSFAVGSELPENETLSAQLSRRCGEYFYNAGSPQPLRLRSLEAVAQRLHLQRGAVIFEFLEARALQAPPSATPEGAKGRLQGVVFRMLGTEWTDRLATPVNELHASPLEALAVKLEKSVQNGWLLPNSFAAFVMQERLRNGEPIVFLPAEFQSPSEPQKAAAAWAVYFAWYASELRKQGLELTVLLVPNRSTIYGPLLEHPLDVSRSVATLADFAAALERAGVTTVALESRSSREAEAGLREDKYLYLRDDTHWTDVSTAIAAEEVLDHLSPSLGCGHR